MAVCDKDVKKMIAMNISGANVRDIAKKFGVHHSTVSRAIKRQPEEVRAKVRQMKKKNDDDILNYFGTKSKKIKSIIDKGLKYLDNDEIFDGISPREVATTIAILYDQPIKGARLELDKNKLKADSDMHMDSMQKLINSLKR